jgi:hypothetical protein
MLVARVGEFVDVEYVIRWIGCQTVSNEIRAYEASAAGYKKPH